MYGPRPRVPDGSPLEPSRVPREEREKGVSKNAIPPLLIRRPTEQEWEGIREDMEGVMDNVGPYQHNIVSCTLRMIADKYGVKIADEVIDEFNLTAMFAIDPEIPKLVGKALEG